MSFSKEFLSEIQEAGWKLSEDGSVWAYLNEDTLQSVIYHPSYGLQVPEVLSGKDLVAISKLLLELSSVTTYHLIDGWVDIWPENKYYKLLKSFQRTNKVLTYGTTLLKLMCFFGFLCIIVLVLGG